MDSVGGRYRTADPPTVSRRSLLRRRIRGKFFHLPNPRFSLARRSPIYLGEARSAKTDPSLPHSYFFGKFRKACPELSTRTRKYDHVCRGDFGCWGRRSSRARPGGLARLYQRCPAPKTPGPKAMGRHWGYCRVAPTRIALQGCPSPARLALPYPQWRSHIRDRIYEFEYLACGEPAEPSKGLTPTAS